MEAKKIDNRAPSSFGSGGKAGRENSIRAENDVSASNPSPMNQVSDRENPNSNRYRATDHRIVPPVWYSFAAPGVANPFETVRLGSTSKRGRG